MKFSLFRTKDLRTSSTIPLRLYTWFTMFTFTVITVKDFYYNRSPYEDFHLSSSFKGAKTWKIEIISNFKVSPFK